jgi:hypothetical protein
MTGKEMQYRFQILSRESVIRNIMTDEIYYWLNYATESLIKDVFGEDNKLLNEFELTQKKKDDIQSIVTFKLYSSPYSTSGNKYRFALPTDYWFRVRENCTISYLNCHRVSTTLSTTIIEANMNNVDRMMDDPYSEYNLLLDQAKPLRLLYENYIELISDGNYSVTNYTLYYIKKPTTIAIGTICSLPSEIHEDIVQLGYKLCMNNFLFKNGLNKKQAEKPSN